jgi:tRNA pseudouridine32 synthase / 23S rRNA pseudouridine746 synthase
MPPYILTLEDREIAAVLTHLRTQWGNQAPEVTPSASQSHQITSRTLNMSALDVVFVDDHLLVLEQAVGFVKRARAWGRQARLPHRQSTGAMARSTHSTPPRYVDIGFDGDCQRPRHAAQASAKRLHNEKFTKSMKPLWLVNFSATETGNADAWSDIHMPLLIDWPNRPKSKVDWEHGKPSHTQWRVKHSNLTNATRVELKPITGRTHQLRSAHDGHWPPILGDALYASPDIQAQSPRLLLHARVLQFKHPVTAEWMAFESTVPF